MKTRITGKLAFAYNTIAKLESENSKLKKELEQFYLERAKELSEAFKDSNIETTGNLSSSNEKL